jgi:hypothetical protein
MYAGEPTHPGGTKKVLTATAPQSLDIYLGQKLKGSLPFDSLQLGVASNFENGSGAVSFIGKGQEVKPDDNPLNVFSRLFGGAAPSNPTGGGAPMMDPDALLRRAPEEERARHHQGRSHPAAGEAGHGGEITPRQPPGRPCATSRRAPPAW